MYRRLGAWPPHIAYFISCGDQFRPVWNGMEWLKDFIHVRAKQIFFSDDLQKYRRFVKFWWYTYFPFHRSWLMQRSSVTGSSLISAILLWINGTSVRVSFSDGMWFGCGAGSNSDLHSLKHMLSKIDSWIFWYTFWVLY